jgi:chorismate mutase
LRGIRGATVAESNTSPAILTATTELLREMMRANSVDPADIASIFFSVTSDLNAEFPAKAARELELTNTALFCLTEIPVPGSLDRCLRILIHFNTDKPQAQIRHIYLGEAIQLRPDHQK